MSQASFVSLTSVPNFSPHDAAVLGTDAHLPALSPDKLTASGLRRCFAKPAVDGLAAFHEPPWHDKPPKPASVLMGLVMRESPTVLLTVRTAHLSSHSGQVAFPGGRRDAHDESDVATALREAREEVGLDPIHVTVLGCLPFYVTGTGYKITPVVALLSPNLALQANPNEVAEVFEVPLAFLMDPANHRRHAMEWRGVKREWYSMPHDAENQQRLIWGATAGMLRHLYLFLSAAD